MSKIVWTLFGITLTVVAALGASALGLIPGPTGQGGAPRVIVEMDGKASALQDSLGKLRAERDRLAADLSAKEADRKAMMEDLADAMGQRDEMRQQLDNTQRQLELLAKSVPEEAKNPASAPIEAATSGCSTLMAKYLSSTLCRARYTRPMPPSPITSSMM